MNKLKYNIYNNKKRGKASNQFLLTRDSPHMGEQYLSQEGVTNDFWLLFSL